MTTTPLLHPSVLRRRLEINADAVRLVDVRTPAEFETAHITGSLNVPVDRLAEQVAALGETGTPIVLVCRSGQRAERARGILQHGGVQQLAVLDGGLQAWLADGHDVVRGRARISLERQVRIAAGAISATGAMLALFVAPQFAVVPALVGSGLVFAGLTDTCAMGSVLSRLPYNRRQSSCDTTRP